MTSLTQLSALKLSELKSRLEDEYAAVKARDLRLNMARGKPGVDQLDISSPLLSIITTADQCFAEDGTDCRNYGLIDGLPEAKRLMASMLDDTPECILVGGNSSLELMYHALTFCIDFGSLGSHPWFQYEKIKWLCPSPGYDRHFRLCESFGIELIAIPLDDEGPDMDMVERLVAEDDSIKGIWCVPKYANPSGISYSEKTVRRLASMPCAAEDFRIFWDNAYCVHHLFDEPSKQDQVLDIGQACREAHKPHRYFKFASTSKVTLPGAGIAAFAASPENLAEFKAHFSLLTVGPNKINQLRHVRFLRDAQGIAEHMSKHAAILRPKFDLVQRKLAEGLAEVEECRWTKPRGGYFISFDAPSGCAKRVVELAKEAGVIFTDAGATWPYGKDPVDSNIRIAPTLPPLEELDAAMDVFVLCVKLAYVEKLLG